MFEMSNEELENLRSQIVTSKEKRGGTRYMPFCFTELSVEQVEKKRYFILYINF